jgi:drug/metabolite transporter (DMT)-like permease
MALLAYLSFTASDTAVKQLHGSLAPFEVSFVVAIFTTVVVLAVELRSVCLRPRARIKHPLAINVRSLAGVGSGLLGVYAVSHITFVEAYGLIYTGPILMTVLATLFLGERLGILEWLAVTAGFAGVLLVVPPDFHALQWGHAAALGAALCNAVAVLLLRRVARDEARITLIGFPLLYALLINGVLALPGFIMPSPTQWLLLAVSGAAVGAAQLSLIGAARRIAVNRIAPIQYTPVLWATIIGAGLYAELPSLPTLCGLALIAGTGIAVLTRAPRPSKPAPAVASQ